ncbi:DUF2784 domain-containing protein [Aromatoleum toluclasticum]|uniref:DUF2784 domain-containing protein n=1 Tax=Aromatoleum toluclasticum TaxID=92003 RepID=UPI00039D3420|nr:DUF2784 domain-containing protein [Aromatoleum toluclasticum]
MLALMAADLVVLVHALFIAFVVLGGLLTLRWPHTVWVHLPVAAYGAGIELIGWTCPLTPLENALRRAAGGVDYRGGFIEHYLIPLIYPAGLTPRVQLVLGLLVLAINVLVYGIVALRRGRRRAGD